MISSDFDLDPWTGQLTSQPGSQFRNNHRAIDSSSPGEYFPNSPTEQRVVVEAAEEEGGARDEGGPGERQTL